MDREKIGRYEIIDELGRGAMGAVLRARDPAMGRDVALKCILSGALAGDQTNEFRERFYREARAAGALAHPGIVPVFDVGEDEGTQFLVMELVQGRTLAEALKQGERFSLERVCEIGEGIAEALGYAHRNGIVHRDIKPANILMTSREVYGAERPRITDFGVAKLAGGEITTTGQLLGTPAFMPPEQFTGAPIDGRADLFSLGVILYRMATGEQPFSGETITAVSYKIVHTDPIPPSRLNPAVGTRLETVLLKCLAKNPADRYQTGEDLAANLAAVRSGVQAAPVAFATVGQATLAGFDPGQTLDVTSGPFPKDHSGKAPQWANMTQGNAAAAPAGPAAPASTWSAPSAQQWSAPPGPAVPPQMPPAPTPVSRPAPTSIAAPSIAPSTTARATGPQARSLAAAGRNNDHTSPAMRSGKIDRLNDAEPQRRGGIPILTWLVVAVLGVLGTWYLLQNRTALQRASDVEQAVPPPPEPIMGALPPTTAANFNPRSLNPAHSANLQLGFDSFPSAILLSVQIDDGKYWSGIAGQSNGHSLVIPAGRHEVRVIAYGAGTETISSNGASVSLAAGRRLLLLTQLRPEPPSGVTTLPPGTQIVLSVKPEP
jgi:serine/threonine protein kinase